MFYHRARPRYHAVPAPAPVTASVFAFIIGGVIFARSPVPVPVWTPLLLLPFCALLSLPARSVCMGLLLGCGWTNVSGQRLMEQWLAPHCERLPLTVRGHVASLPELVDRGSGRSYQRFLLDVSELAPHGCVGPGRLRLTYYGDTGLAPGQYGEFTALLRVPWGLANPGTGNRESWYAANGIHAVGSVRHLVIEEGTVPWRYRHHVARAAVIQSIDDLSGDRRAIGLLTALTVGARHRLAAEDWTLLRELGVLHLAVISGLHVSLAAAAGAFFGKLVSRAASLAGAGTQWRQLPGVFALASAGVYAALAGFSLPTVRALIMLAGLVFALTFDRSPTSPRTLLLAAFLLVLLEPLATLSSGFWLSICAVAALLWVIAWQPPRCRVAAALRIHLYLCVAMLPLTGWWFGGGSVVAPLANAIAVPVVGLAVVPMTLLASAVDTVSPPVAQWIWQWPLALLTLLLSLADAFAVPAQDIGYRPLGGGVYAAINGLLAALLLGLPLPRHLKAAAACLLLPLLLREPSPRFPARAELAVLDVGQGTAVVVSDGRRALVYDTGGGQPGGYTLADAVIAPFLEHRGIRAISTLVVSHADRDHSAGTQALLDAFPVARLWRGQALPGVSRGSPCRGGRTWAWPGNIRFQFLTGSQEPPRSANRASCVLWVDLAGHRFLLPGDIDAARERELVRYWREGLRADWLLAAHHGSGSSTASAWLRAVDPVGVVFNHGRANPFGHPHPDVVARLERRGIRIRSTASDGAILFRVTHRGNLEITTARGGHAPFWRPPG